MSALRSSLQSAPAPGTSHGRCGCSSGVINPLSRSRSGAEMTAAFPARARAAAIFGSCASDHFLNPLVRLFIEIPMIGVLFRIQEYYMGTISIRSEQNLAIERKSFLRHLYSDGLTSKECGAIFHLIRKIRSLTAEFFSSQSPKRQFPIGFLVRPIITDIRPRPPGSGRRRASEATSCRPQPRCETDRIRRDVKPRS
jgi:hypothetical protein